MKRLTAEEWRDEGIRRFGPNEMDWRFVCPSCGVVASVQEWKDVGAEQSAVAFSCIGRWMRNAKDIFSSPGPCNYAGGGLIRLNPIEVVMEDGVSHNIFDFAPSDKI